MRDLKVAGFTIIETLIVVAVTGVLLSVGILGQGVVRERAQFTDAVQTLESEIEGYKTEAVTRLNLGDGASSRGDNQNRVIFATMLVFRPGQAEYKIVTLSHAARDINGNFVEIISDARVESINTQQVKWGVAYTGLRYASEDSSDPLRVRTACLVFHQSLKDSTLKSIVISDDVETICDYELTPGDVVDLEILSEKSSTPTTTYHGVAPKLEFTDGSRFADLIVNTQTSSGSIEVIQR